MHSPQIALTQTKLQQVASNLARGVEAYETAVEGKVAGDAVPCMPETSAQLGESPVESVEVQVTSAANTERLIRI